MGVFNIFKNRASVAKQAVGVTPPVGDAVAALTHPDNPASLSVTPISNGFLITRRVYNSSGPDHFEARFVGTADQIGPEMVAMLATIRITK